MADNKSGPVQHKERSVLHAFLHGFFPSIVVQVLLDNKGAMYGFITTPVFSSLVLKKEGHKGVDAFTTIRFMAEDILSGTSSLAGSVLMTMVRFLLKRVGTSLITLFL